MILDFDLDFLRAAAALLDSSLDRLQTESRASPDPDAFGIFDEPCSERCTYKRWRATTRGPTIECLKHAES